MQKMHRYLWLSQLPLYTFTHILVLFTGTVLIYLLTFLSTCVTCFLICGVSGRRPSLSVELFSDILQTKRVIEK